MTRKDESGRTIVYVEGTDNVINFPDRDSIEYWKKIGLEYNQKWMYKGYRWYFQKPNPNNLNDTVIVFDTKKWSASEIARRKANGFLGIREHKL